MKTKSIWGQAPKRLYRLIELAEREYYKEFTACIVGCSDGKFLLPFARKRHKVHGYDIDEVALYGGLKTFPIVPNREKHDYSKDFVPEQFDTIEQEIKGCQERIKLEGLEDYCSIKRKDFYHSINTMKFDVVFTSCSLHYSVNKDITLSDKVNKLKEIVEVSGYLYIDYMLAIEEIDLEKYPDSKFFRKGDMKKFFNDDWQIINIKENNKISFEAAHVDVPYDHFHRFGYALVKRLR